MTRGFQVTYWQTGTTPPKPGTRVAIYQCSKCALKFDEPQRFDDGQGNSFSWCPCCHSPDIEYWRTILVGPKTVPLPAISNTRDIENMVMLDLFLDGELDGGLAL